MRAQRRDAGHHRRFAVQRVTSVFKIATFSSNRSVALSPSEPSATMPVQPLSTSHARVFRDERVIHAVVRFERGRHRGNDSCPFHFHNYLLSVVVVIKLLTRAGRTGGRTDSMPQPKIIFAAAPHTRPWHAPMPQRDKSFASRHPENCFTRPSVHILATAQQRFVRRQSFQFRRATRKPSPAPREMNATTHACRTMLPRAPFVRSPRNRQSALRSSAQSAPPMPVGSPAQKTSATLVVCSDPPEQIRFPVRNRPPAAIPHSAPD